MNPDPAKIKDKKSKGLKSKLKKAVSSEDQPKQNRFEALALCYANRSAALRRLCQYEDCLRDIARAARFGYPKENMFKLWERKGKCYYGLKRYELAAKCIRQSLNALKESGLSDLSKSSKTTELQGLLKDWRSAQELAQIGVDKPNLNPSDAPQVMGATGPLVLMAPEPVKNRKVSSEPAPAAPTAPSPPTLQLADGTTINPSARLDRRAGSVRRKDPNSPNGDPPSGPATLSPSPAVSPTRELPRADSKMSISQISMGGNLPPGLRPDAEVPELSYGTNPRMPSASVGIDLRFSPEKGRFFVAAQDLLPGNISFQNMPYPFLPRLLRANHDYDSKWLYFLEPLGQNETLLLNYFLCAFR